MYYAGQSIEIVWKVQNLGYGVTSVSKWFDKCNWVSNSSSSSSQMIFLGVVSHSGELSPFETYTVKQLFNLPKYIFGAYKVIVQTDVYNDVFENYNDDNNIKDSVSF